MKVSEFYLPPSPEFQEREPRNLLSELINYLEAINIYEMFKSSSSLSPGT